MYIHEVNKEMSIKYWLEDLKERHHRKLQNMDTEVIQKTAKYGYGSNTIPEYNLPI